MPTVPVPQTRRALRAAGALLALAATGVLALGGDASAAYVAVGVLALAGAALVLAAALAGAPAPAGRAHRVVVVGGGFGGLQAVKGLAGAPVEVTLVDRRNHHLFTPLLYQVATGLLAPGEIATPLRALVRRRRDVRVVLGEVEGIDLAARRVHVATAAGGPAEPLPYDTLVVAAGSQYAYFGHDEWREHAPSIKTLDDALDVRGRILRAFEAAELEEDPAVRAAWLTFVVVGGGPTGVELAGQVAEIARDALRHDFRAIDPAAGRVLLVEHGDRVLATYPAGLSAAAERGLRELGVTPLLGRGVVDVDEEGVVVQDRGGARRRIAARTVVWAAGVTASPLACELAASSGAELDRGGRVTVEADLTLPGHPEVLAVGDMVRVRGRDGRVRTFAGVSPVAMQQGRHAARVVRARLRGRPAPDFRYRHKGDVATVGRARAVADLHGLHLRGPVAWLFWLALHLFYLAGAENRVLVLVRWTAAFATRDRGARLITGAATPPRPAAGAPRPSAQHL